MEILKGKFFKFITYVLLVVCSYCFTGGDNFLLYAASLSTTGGSRQEAEGRWQREKMVIGYR